MNGGKMPAAMTTNGGNLRNQTSTTNQTSCPKNLWNDLQPNKTNIKKGVNTPKMRMLAGIALEMSQNLEIQLFTA
jgi:hypothetical protein